MLNLEHKVFTKIQSRKHILSTLAFLGAALFFIAKPIIAQTLPATLSAKQEQIGEHSSANDFYNDIQLGLQNLKINPAAQSLEQEITNQDYKSTWDEFGTNVLIDGATPPGEIDNNITRDIIQSVQVEQNYDREEATYLESSNITPEEIQTMEESGGSDVPPSESIDPNPSAEVNPDVSLSSSESNQQIISEEATTTENAVATTTTGAAIISTETNMPPSEASAPSDETIFDAILQSEQANPSQIEPTPSSSEPAPPEPSPVP